MEWIDIAKGVSIILVVVGHTGRGLSGAGLPDEGGVLGLMDRAIYAFHMPLFFLLSGITFGMRPPATIRPSLVNRTLRLFYALVIWTYVFLAMRALVGARTNANGSWQEVLQMPLPPFEHFWFLWALLINMVVLALVRLAVRSVVPDLWFWSAAVVTSIVANLTVVFSHELAPWFGSALSGSLVFTVGGLIGASSFVRAIPRIGLASLGGVVFISGLWITASIGLPVSYLVSGLALSLFFILPVIALSHYFNRSAGSRALAFVGFISLAIYVMHTIFSASVRIVLLYAGYTDLTLHLVLGTVVGICGPLFVYLAARRFNMLRVIGLA